MKKPSIPQNENQRMRALKKYRILDTGPEESFDEITKLAATLCGTKIALICLVDTDRQWFKSSYGLDIKQTSRNVSFCAHAILGEDIFLVKDASQDIRFCDNPLFLGDPHVRFYLGAPLITASGDKIGTLCVINDEVIELSKIQINTLKTLAKYVMDLMELRLKNEELSQLAYQFNDVQSMSRTGGWEYDIEANKVYWSDGIFEIHQMTKGSAPELDTAMSFFSLEDRAKLKETFDLACKEGIPFDQEYRFIDAKGGRKWVRTIGKPVYNGDGEILKIVGTFQDITDTKQSELELMERTNRLEAYARGLNAYAIMAKTDARGKITYVNDLFCQISGWSREEILGQDHRVLNSSHHPKSFFKELWSTISSGKVWRGEIKNSTKNGSYYWVDTTIAPDFDQNGRIQGYISFRYDITERKIIEERLQESETKFRLLFDQTVEAVVIVAPPSWRFTGANPAAIKIFGAQNLEELCSMGPADLSPEFQKDGDLSSIKAKRAIAIAMEQGSYFFEWVHKKIDGTLMDCTVLLSRITQNDSTYIQASIRDVTEERRAQAALLDSQLALEKSHYFLDLALESTGLGIWDWNLVTQEITFDHRWASMLGVDHNNLKNDLSTWESRVHPEDLPKALEIVKEYFDGKTSYYDNTFRMRHQDGHWVYILGRGKFSDWDEAGKPIRFTGTHFDLTAHKTMERQFIEAQSISKIGSWDFNLATNKLTWSSEHYKIFEIPEPQPSDRLYELYRERIHPDDLFVLDELMSKSWDQNEDFEFDHRVILDGGKRIKYVRGIGKVTRDKFGRAILLSGTCQDNTKDVESESRLKTLLEAMSEGLLVWDGTRYSVHNSSALKILNVSADEINGHQSLDLIWKMIKQDGTDLLEKEFPGVIAYKTGESISDMTIGVKLLSDEIRWLRLSAIPVNRNEGRRVLITFADISDLINTYEENRFVLDSLEIGLWKWNFSTKFTDWDRSMHHLYGIQPGEFNGDYRTWEKFLTEDSKKLLLSDFAKIIAGARELNSTYEIITKDGIPKAIGCMAKVMRNDLGEPLMMFGINWDKTKEVELEKSLQQETAKAMHNAKLASIGQLAAGVGHEINNPLSIISGQLSIAAQMLEAEGSFSKGVSDRFRRMELSVERITNIVKGLRTFARSDDNKIGEFDPFELLTETVDMLKELYLRDEVIVEFKGRHREARLYGNRGRIQQVLVNLLSNAKDATLKKTDRRISVSVHYEKDSIVIKVQDNGCGIPKQLLESIFEPFFTTKEVNKGTGLGLSLANTIVKEHNGRIELDSEVGIGTEFRVHLPLTFMAQDFLGTPDPVESPMMKLPSQGKLDYRVLFIDDEEDLREVMSFILTKSISYVKIASNVPEAIDFLKKVEVDLVISDMKMPGIDGFEFLSQLRAMKGIHQPRFIFATGGIDLDEEKKHIIDTQTNGLIMKPFKKQEILDKIKEIMGQVKVG